jgi:hypothetical protein
MEADLEENFGNSMLRLSDETQDERLMAQPNYFQAQDTP